MDPWAELAIFTQWTFIYIATAAIFLSLIYGDEWKDDLNLKPIYIASESKLLSGIAKILLV